MCDSSEEQGPSYYGEFNIDPQYCKFYYTYIIDNEHLGVILDDRSQLNIKPGQHNYTLSVKVLMSEYEYYYAVVPFIKVQKGDRDSPIDKEYKMISNPEIDFDLPIKKERVIEMIANKELIVGVCSHFYSPDLIEIIPHIGEDGEENEILEYYKDQRSDKIVIRYRWVQHDFLFPDPNQMTF